MRTNLHLTPLERKIKACALWQVIRRIGTPKHGNVKWYIAISLCNGIADEVYYDCEKKKWSHIKYEKYVGNSFRLTSHTILL